MKKQQSEAAKLAAAEQQRLNKLYNDVLGETGATEILEDIERKFELRSMLKRGSDGRIDVSATLANNGAYEVVSWIKQRIELGSKGE